MDEIIRLLETLCIELHCKHVMGTITCLPCDKRIAEIKSEIEYYIEDAVRGDEN